MASLSVIQSQVLLLVKWLPGDSLGGNSPSPLPWQHAVISISVFFLWESRFLRVYATHDYLVSLAERKEPFQPSFCTKRHYQPTTDFFFVTFSYSCHHSFLASQGFPETFLEAAILLLWEECRTSENKTQTQVVGGKEDLLRYRASSWISPKMAPAP
jgi:hypothetical protein